MSTSAPRIMRSADFLASIGINVHMDVPAYADAARVDTMLDYLGIANVRANEPWSSQGAAGIEYLGQHGARLDLLVNGNGPLDLARTMSTIQHYAPYLNAVEGPNEVNLWPVQYAGLDGLPAAIAFQKDFYAAMKANPAFATVPVYLFTLGGLNPKDVPG